MVGATSRQMIAPARPPKGEGEVAAWLELARDPERWQKQLAAMQGLRDEANKAVKEANAALADIKVKSSDLAGCEKALAERLAQFEADKVAQENGFARRDARLVQDRDALARERAEFDELYAAETTRLGELKTTMNDREAAMAERETAAAKLEKEASAMKARADAAIAKDEQRRKQLLAIAGS